MFLIFYYNKNQDTAVFVKTDNFSTKTDKLNTQNIYWSINRSLIGHWNIKSFGGYKTMHFYDWLPSDGIPTPKTAFIRYISELPNARVKVIWNKVLTIFISWIYDYKKTPEYDTLQKNTTRFFTPCKQKLTRSMTYSGKYFL